MLSEWTALPMDVRLTAQVFRYPTASPLEVILDTATDGIELTDFVDSISQSSNEATIRLRWHMELYQVGQQPQTDEVCAIFMNSQLLWVGIIQSINDYGESKGNRSMSFVARSRDTSPLWRTAQVVSSSYPLGTDARAIINEVADFLHLDAAELDLPASFGLTTVHSSTQVAMVTPWEVLRTLLEPIGGEPYVDALGRLKVVSRATDAVATHTITAERLVTVSGSKSQPATNKVRIKWIDPELTKTNGDDQVLATTTLTAGFFQSSVEQTVYFSEDRTQRAEGTRLVISQSCNSGLLPVANEEYEQDGPLSGIVILRSNAFIATLAAAALAEMVANALVPDGVAVFVTIPQGRILHAASEAFIMLTMMSIGTGVYEIWGRPYDYVHATNTTEAMLTGTPDWSDNAIEIENDFVMDEPMAQGMAVRELVYANRSAQTYSISVVDDPSIERGDILTLPDTSRFYVVNYRRELKRGNPHILQLDGFRV